MDHLVEFPHVFAVDLETEVVILVDGTTWPVDTWYDPIARECTPDRAMAFVFQGPFELWYAVNIKDIHLPDVIN